LSSFSPRTVGSPGEARSFDYIRSALREADISFSTHDFTSYGSLHSFSAAVDAVIPGGDGDTLYFVVPVSHPPSARSGHDGSAGIALGLSICRQLAGTSLPLEVHVLFLGADFGGSSDFSRGSRVFLQNFYSPGQTAFVYLHLPARPEEVQLLPASTKHVSPYWLLEGIASQMRSEGVRPSLDFISFQLYRLGLNDAPSPIHPYFEEGYPAIYLTGSSANDPAAGESPAGEAGGNLFRLSKALSRSVSDLGDDLPETWDRHYQYIPLGESSIRITQQQYVLVLLVLFLLVLLYPFIRAKHFLKYGRSIIRNIGALPILYLLMFLYLYLATLLLEGVTRFQAYPMWWQERPVQFILLKLSAAALLFVLTHKLVHLIRFTRLRGSFYSASALVFFLIDIIILSVIDLSLSLYGAPVFLFAFLFSITPKRALKLLFLILALLSTAVPVYLLFRSGMSSAIRPLLLSRTTGNMLIAFHFLPFMLLIIRMRMLFHHPNPRITKRVVYVFDLLFGSLTAFFLGLLIFSAPFGQDNPQPVEVREHTAEGDMLRRVEIASPAPLGSFSLQTGTERVTVASKRKSFSANVPNETDLLNAGISKEAFLGRALYTLRVEPLYDPQWLHVRISSPDEIVIYDSRFPFTYEPDRRTARFDIGRNPPVPLEVRFTLPADFAGELLLEAEYERPPYPLRTEGKPLRLDYHLSVNSRIPIEGYAR
jgi:hypothetical protein